MFLNRDWSVLVYANGFTLWHYKTSDPITKLDDPTYLGGIWRICNVGDLIIINTPQGAFFRQIKCVEKDFVELGALN